MDNKSSLTLGVCVTVAAFIVAFAPRRKPIE